MACPPRHEPSSRSTAPRSATLDLDRPPADEAGGKPTGKPVPANPYGQRYGRMVDGGCMTRKGSEVQVPYGPPRRSRSGGLPPAGLPPFVDATECRWTRQHARPPRTRRCPKEVLLTTLGKRGAAPLPVPANRRYRFGYWPAGHRGASKVSRRSSLSALNASPGPLSSHMAAGPTGVPAPMPHSSKPDRCRKHAGGRASSAGLLPLRQRPRAVGGGGRGPPFSPAGAIVRFDQVA